MKITKVDVIWNYIATFLKIASSALLLPFLLHKLPSEDVGIWSVFSSIAALVFLVDFGFNSSFSRNVTYIYSGVDELKSQGHVALNIGNTAVNINYNLLKGMISAMKWFYSRAALILLFLLCTFGTYYISVLLENYHGNKLYIYISWILFCFINTYNLYTLYYDALLEGVGFIKASKQITTVGYIVYLCVASVTIFMGLGLIAVVLAQLCSITFIRFLSYRKFFTAELQSKLKITVGSNKKDILKAVYPNAFKYGITSVGGFMIQKSAIFIGSLYITLSAIASFGIAKQMIDITVAVANISLATYLPQIANLRIESNYVKIKKIYIKGLLISNMVFLVGATVIVLFGNPILNIIRSHTLIADHQVLIAMVFSSLIGLNAGISGSVISTKNHIPFARPSIYSGIATITLLYITFKFTHLGLLGMALAPGIIDLCYQGWKWPLVVIKELKITIRDVSDVIYEAFNNLKSKAR
jgi:O-antigen/teichoic acid export membrane protein